MTTLQSYSSEPDISGLANSPIANSIGWSLLRSMVATLLFAMLVLFSFGAKAATYFVHDTTAEPSVAHENARIATDLIKNSVSARPGDMLVEDEFRADYILQPKLVKLGESHILTVEKRRGQDVLFAAQTKMAQIDQLDRAARATTNAAIDEPTRSRLPPARANAGQRVIRPTVPYQVYTVPEDTYVRRERIVQPRTTASGATTGIDDGSIAPESRAGVPVIDYYGRRQSYWTVGIGPFLSRRLDSDHVMYNATLGHTWDVNPRASVKILGEANLSSGGDDARFFNLGAGASYFFQALQHAPYVTADIGYGYATDADGNDGEGFSFGTGIGYQFFRDTETTLDLLLRYAVIFDPVQNRTGDPSIVGLRLAVNF